MGLPKIKINFSSKGSSAVRRSARGIVAIIIKDESPLFDFKSYKKLEDVDKTNFTVENYNYIQDVFKGTPSEVIVAVVKTLDLTLASALTKVGVKKFNYLVMPDADVSEQTEIMSFIKSKNKNEDKTFKAVLAKSKGDDEAIINVTAEEIEIGGVTHTAGEFTARIAGILAAIGLDRSATYYVIPEVTSVKYKENPDEAIDAGELFLIDDGEKIKIARAVNSLTTVTSINEGTIKSPEFKKIKIVEGAHLMKEDIRSTFENDYVGKYVNNYDNKVIFITAINSYFKELAKLSVLDNGYENKAEIDIEAQRRYIESIGVSTEGMTEQQIKEYNTGSHVFVKANVKFVDAMEDLDFDMAM